MTTCKNCGNKFEGKFCNECGQQSNVERITVKHLSKDLFRIFARPETGKFFLAKELLIHPGEVVRGYLEGKRKKYYNPIQFYIGTSAVLLYLHIKLDIGTLLVGGGQMTSQSDTTGRQFLDFFYQNFNYLQFAAVPIMALFSYLFFKKAGYNYAEHLVISTYFSSQRQMLNILLVFIMYLLPDHAVFISNFFILFWMAYLSFDYIDLFRSVNKAGTVIKTLLASTLYLAALMIVSVGVFVIFFYNE